MAAAVGVTMPTIRRLERGGAVNPKLRTLVNCAIAVDDAEGFARYLTSTTARGNYYAGHEDEAEGDAGGGVVPQSRWHGSPRMLATRASPRSSGWAAPNCSRENCPEATTGIEPV